jgi:hypothetical protein
MDVCLVERGICLCSMDAVCQTNVCCIFMMIVHLDDDVDKWWTKLNACKWLRYVSKTLHGAASLAKLLDFKCIELAGENTIRESQQSMNHSMYS